MNVNEVVASDKYVHCMLKWAPLGF